MPIVTLDQLLRCFDLEPAGQDAYTGPNLEMPYYRIFGGQLLAQAVAVATRDTPGKQVKSLHCLFPREGDLQKPVTYRLLRPHDGRSFATRQITADQEGRVILSASVSLHVPEAGPEHQAPMPAVPAPDALAPADLSMLPFDTRIEDGIDLGVRDEGPADYRFWLRAKAALADDPALHQGLLAHATDLTLIGTALRPLSGLSQADSPDRIHTAVTSHTLWYHAPFRMDDWILLAQTSPRLGGSRAFGQGHAFHRDGSLVASFAQEAMVRLRA